MAVLDTVCLVSSPRTGASHLLSLCDNLAEAQSFPQLFEPLAERLSPEAAMGSAIEATRAAGRRVMLFRLWHDMLSIEEAIAVADRRGVRLVLVMRRQIDAYISWCKAIELGQWQGVDTSEHEAIRLDRRLRRLHGGAGDLVRPLADLAEPPLPARSRSSATRPTSTSRRNGR